MIYIGFILQSRMRLELACLLGLSFLFLLLLRLNDDLMVLFWFSWFDLFEVERLRNSLMSVFGFPGLKKQHLVVVHLLKIRNVMDLALQFMIFRVLLFQFFLFFSDKFIVILKILHGGRKTCTLQQFHSSSLPLRLITSECVGLIGGLWDGSGVESSIPVVVIIHLLDLLIVSDCEVEWLCDCLYFYCGFRSLFWRMISGWRNRCCVEYYFFLFGLYRWFSCYLINNRRLLGWLFVGLGFIRNRVLFIEQLINIVISFELTNFFLIPCQGRQSHKSNILFLFRQFELGIEVKIGLPDLFKITECNASFLNFCIFEPFIDKVSILKDQYIMISSRNIDLLIFGKDKPRNRFLKSTWPL